ncbi:MAG: hypothetical protein JW798_05970 [Prolixibacteraceae bacterium]|nr:hypothetical protein [Prolixibacteraceae bacterium]
MKEKIVELFEMLPHGEQRELLRELNKMVISENPIVDVNLRCQSKYGKNIEFKITTNTENTPPVIKVEIITPWGNFFGEGSNQKIAKAKASEIALVALEDETNNPNV